MATITYQFERAVEEPDLEETLLEVSLKNGIPHAHVCGGRARCSTCRVLVVKGPEHLRPPTDAERALAERRGFDGTVRLACQARVGGDVTIRRLVMDEEDTRLAVGEGVDGAGREENVAVLFADIRDFTVFSEANYPYDVVHILNRYFRPVGDAVLGNHGYIDKYIGDGVMAVFGLERDDPAETCLDAVRAALGIRAALDEVNAYIAKITDARLAVGVGVHFGTAVVGEIGHASKKQLTAIGDTVNIASRIESATKTCGVDILVSEAVVERAADRIRLGRSFTTELKGKSGSFTLHEVLDEK